MHIQLNWITLLVIILELIFTALCGIKELKSFVVVIIAQLVLTPPALAVWDYFIINIASESFMNKVVISLLIQSMLVAIEALIYEWLTKIPKSLLFSFGANLLSYSVFAGIFVYNYMGRWLC